MVGVVKTDDARVVNYRAAVQTNAEVETFFGVREEDVTEIFEVIHAAQLRAEVESVDKSLGVALIDA